MLTRERHALLLDRLERDGRIVAKEMAAELATSEDTIRRDLRTLAKDGKLQRVHGGALPASSASADFSGRLNVSTEEKAALACAAVGLIEPGQLVFIDGGTTNVQLVRALPADLDIRVVTHSPSIAVELAAHPRIEVDLIGGRLFKHSIVAVGTASSEAIRRVQPDLFVMGVTGLHPEAGATTADAEEAAVKALILSRSAETMVLASREKLGAASPYLIATTSSLTTIVVARDAPETVRDALGSTGPTIVQAVR
jgi:DeoR/GlpR family transcriptional regulator of sugar metabolism